MIDSILSVLTGGATGVIGTVVSGVVGHFQAKRKFEQQLSLRRLDLEAMQIEAKAAAAASAVRAESEATSAELAALTASYREASNRVSMRGDSVLLVLADFVRTMVRPALTIGLVGLTAWIYTTAPALRPTVIDTVLYLTTAAVLWWFGSRAAEKVLAKG